jgi:exodeoxyribonuclease VII large subunit
MSRLVTHDGRGSLIVRFPFDRRLVDLVKGLPSRRWNAADKHWVVPAQDALELVELLADERFSFCDATLNLYRDQGGTRPLEAARAPRTPRGPGLFDEPDQTGPGDDGARSGAAGPADWTVSRLNQQVAAVLAGAFPAPVWLVGEISGFNKSAHRRIVGFRLVERDEQGKPVSEVNATLFDDARREIQRRLAAAGDPFKLEDEVTVRVLARVELYAPWGQYRVRIEDLDVQYTLGEAARRREEIVRKLTEEGLAERNRALPFPALPLRVGLITSLGSDAYNDVLRTLQESGYAFQVTVHGARVQGRSTEPSVLNALDWLRERADRFDVVMICRGGGSRTDLAWFDSEALGRAVALFPLPVVVGIGHEQDLSVLDFVGWRSKTPTAAAQFLVERVTEALRRVEEAALAVVEAAAARVREEAQAAADRARRLVRAVRTLLERERTETSRWISRVPRGAAMLLGRRRAELDAGARQLVQGARRDLAAATTRTTELARALAPRSARRVATELERTEARARRLHLVHPHRVVERGYAILRGPTGRVVTAAAAAPAGTPLRAELKRGALRVRSEGPEQEGDAS